MKTQTNRFRITQHGDMDFTIARSYRHENKRLFRAPKVKYVWQPIQDWAKAKDYRYSIPAKRWTSLEDCKSYIDKTLADEAKYPIVTKYP